MAIMAYIDGGGGLDVAYMGEFAAQTSDLTSRALTGESANAGAEHPQRVIIGLASWGSSSQRGLNSATLLGIPATIIRQVGMAAGGAAIVLAECPIDAPASPLMTLSFNGITTNCNGALVRAVGLSSITPVDFDGDIDEADGTLTDGINVLAGGFIVGAGVIAGASAATWGNIAEQYDATIETRRHTFAYSEGLSLETPRTVTMTNAGSDDACFAIASFR